METWEGGSASLCYRPIDPDIFHNVADKCRDTMLHHVVTSDSAEAVQLVLENTPAGLVCGLDVWKSVALHRARSHTVALMLLEAAFVAGKNSSGVKSCLAASTRADVKDSLVQAGDTPLHAACRYDLPGMVAVLIGAARVPLFLPGGTQPNAPAEQPGSGQPNPNPWLCSCKNRLTQVLVLVWERNAHTRKECTSSRAGGLLLGEASWR